MGPALRWAGLGHQRQEYPDFPQADSYPSDDFVVSDPAWFITRVFAPGIEVGDSRANLSVNMLVGPTPNFFDATLFAHGTQDGEDLVFTPNKTLAQGSYWLFTYVVRSFGRGGQRFQKTTTPVRGSEGYFHNPGGGYGLGTDPVPLAVIFGRPQDLAFRIEGEIVPEPASITALILGGIAIWRRKRG